MGAALAAEVLFKQTLFAHTVGSLQYMLLLGFVIALEQSAPRENAPFRWLGRLSASLGKSLAGRAARAVVCLVACALASATVLANVRIYMGADALQRFAAPGAAMSTLDETIAAFPPFANTGRRLFFDDLADHWRRLRASESRVAAELLARADIEAVAAEAAEPDSWVMPHSLTRLYREVALTEPEYQARAARYQRRSLELAPNIEIKPLRNFPTAPTEKAGRRHR